MHSPVFPEGPQPLTVPEKRRSLHCRELLKVTFRGFNEQHKELKSLKVNLLCSVSCHLPRLQLQYGKGDKI